VGVKIDDLLISQPDTGEQALEITEILVRSGAVDVIVVDSVAALVPKAEIEGIWAMPIWASGKADVPGLEEIDCHDQQVEYDRDLRQPDSDENRNHVRKSGDHHRRQCPQVLLLCSA